MPACDGNSCTAAFNSACCSPFSAGGNLPTAQKPAPSDRLPRMPRPIGQWCGHPFPTPEPPPRPSNPAPAATARATFPAPVASEPDTSAVVPQPHPFATAPAALPSPTYPTATPNSDLFTDQLNHRQCYPTPMRVSPWLQFSCWFESFLYVRLCPVTVLLRVGVSSALRTGRLEGDLEGSTTSHARVGTMFSDAFTARPMGQPAPRLRGSGMPSNR